MIPLIVVKTKWKTLSAIQMVINHSVCFCFNVKTITFWDLRLNKSSDEKEVLWHPDWKLLHLYEYIAELSFFRYKQEPENKSYHHYWLLINDFTISKQHYVVILQLRWLCVIICTCKWVKLWFSLKQIIVSFLLL